MVANGGGERCFYQVEKDVFTFTWLAAAQRGGEEHREPRRRPGVIWEDRHHRVRVTFQFSFFKKNQIPFLRMINKENDKNK